MVRSAGTHEGWIKPDQLAAPARSYRWVFQPLRTCRPWPLDWVEPVAWREAPEETWQ